MLIPIIRQHLYCYATRWPEMEHYIMSFATSQWKELRVGRWGWWSTPIIIWEQEEWKWRKVVVTMHLLKRTGVQLIGSKSKCMKQPDQSRKVSSTLSSHSTLRLFLTCDVNAIHMQLLNCHAKQLNLVGSHSPEGNRFLVRQMGVRVEFARWKVT